MKCLPTFWGHPDVGALICPSALQDDTYAHMHLLPLLRELLCIKVTSHSCKAVATPIAPSPQGRGLHASVPANPGKTAYEIKGTSQSSPCRPHRPPPAADKQGVQTERAESPAQPRGSWQQLGREDGAGGWGLGERRVSGPVVWWESQTHHQTCSPKPLVSATPCRRLCSFCCAGRCEARGAISKSGVPHHPVLLAHAVPSSSGMGTSRSPGVCPWPLNTGRRRWLAGLGWFALPRLPPTPAPFIQTVLGSPATPAQGHLLCSSGSRGVGWVEFSPCSFWEQGLGPTEKRRGQSLFSLEESC